MANITCEECKERLSLNPEVGYYHKGRYYPPLCQGCSQEYEKSLTSQIESLKERTDDLEMIVCLPGEIPYKYQYLLDQLRAEVAHIHGELHKKKSVKKAGSYA